MPGPPPLARRSRRVLIAALTLGTVALGGASRPAPSTAVATPSPSAPYERGEVVVGFRAGISARMESVTAPTSISIPVAESAPAVDGVVQTQVQSIKSAIVAQEKFLGELVGHASRWEMSGGELRLFFPTESRALADMLQARDPMERLRNIVSRILGHTVRVCVKLEAVPAAGGTTTNGTRELRAKFEQDPIVRAMLERFGGKISDVKRRGEE